jgi:hypothetical protein
MSGAAAAGQLVQQNISLAEGEQQLGLSGQQTGAGIQEAGTQLANQVGQALFNEYASIATQSGALQAQMWQQAMQGEGAIGNLMNSTLNAFGYSMKTQEDVLQANESSAQLQAGIQSQAAQMQAQGSSSLMSGLGSLLGQGGGSSGGLLGGLGSLLGTTGASSAITGVGANGLAVAGGAAGGSGLLGALGGAGGSAIGAIGTALTFIFCQVAVSVYGIEDPHWFLFREYLLFRAPRSLRCAYVKNASWVSALVRKHVWIKRTIKCLMNFAIWYDSATREI